MTNLETYCTSALRLSEASAEALLGEIQNKISVARAELIRLGIPVEIANDENNMLVCNVIIKFVCSEMASMDVERERAYEIYRLCLDELRKSVANV